MEEDPIKNLRDVLCSIRKGLEKQLEVLRAYNLRWKERKAERDRLLRRLQIHPEG